MIVPKYMQGLAHAISVTLIGCGGTGSVLLQHLARMNRSLIAQGKKGIILTCIDDDLVTEANLGRQLYTTADLGRPKCTVMVERINRFYGTNWMAIPRRFDTPLTTMDSFPGNVVITAVDNVATRKSVSNYLGNCSINKYHESIHNLFWMDTGNGKDFGQVILSWPRMDLPSPFDMFPDMEKDEKLDDTPSCSLAEALEKQDLFINSVIALEAAELLWSLTQKPDIIWRGAFINLNKQSPIKRIRV